MRKFLVAITAGFLSCQTSYAFGDPVDAGVAAWCGARRGGASIDEANKQLRRSMSAQYMMSTDFASAIVGILGNRQGMQSQIEYRISRDCPQYQYGDSPVQPSKPTDEPSSPMHAENEKFCWDNPWSKKCGGAGSEADIKNIETQPTSKVKESGLINAMTKQDGKKMKQAHLNCLKAKDYAGCMKFQLQAQ